MQINYALGLVGPRHLAGFYTKTALFAALDKHHNKAPGWAEEQARQRYAASVDPEQFTGMIFTYANSQAQGCSGLQTSKAKHTSQFAYGLNFLLHPNS